jgi:hypothetical protein
LFKVLIHNININNNIIRAIKKREELTVTTASIEANKNEMKRNETK